MSTFSTTAVNQPGGMAYYTNSKSGEDIALPYRQAPIRFGAMRKNGLSSNSWRVWVGGDGSAYIVCRDHMQGLKVSLHSSGQQKITLESPPGAVLPGGTLDWGRWKEPPFYNAPKVVPTFYLLFPTWALGLTQEMRDASAASWDGNHVFIEAAESPKATVVSFVITDDDLSMTFNGGGENPSFPLGLLAVRLGKKLWVVAHNVSEEPIVRLANNLLEHIDTTMGKQLHDEHSGQTLGISATGLSEGGGRYLIAAPLLVM
jgi:hypothetical protein